MTTPEPTGPRLPIATAPADPPALPASGPSSWVMIGLLVVLGGGGALLGGGAVVAAVVVWLLGGLGWLVIYLVDLHRAPRLPADDSIAPLVTQRLAEAAAARGERLDRSADPSRRRWSYGGRPLWADEVPFEDGWLTALERGIADEAELIAGLGRSILLDETCAARPMVVRLAIDVRIPFRFHRTTLGGRRSESGDSVFDDAVWVEGDALALAAYLDDGRRALIERLVRARVLDGHRLTLAFGPHDPARAARIIDALIALVDRLEAPWTPVVEHLVDVIEATRSVLLRRHALGVLAREAAAHLGVQALAARLLDDRDEEIGAAARGILATADEAGSGEAGSGAGLSRPGP